jgi:glycosyltransferase involved in cell wall biosynthesis
VNIWLVNPFDSLPGEQARAGRYAFFADMLSQAGHTVTWWTSAFSHRTKSYRSTRTWGGRLPNGVTVNILWAPAYYQNIDVRRLLNHFLWGRGFYKAACLTDIPPDVIIASSPPLYAANRALDIACRRNAQVIIDVQDLWPETFVIAFPPPMRGLGMTLLRPLTALEDANFRQANGLIAISQTLLNRALATDQEKKVRGVIPLGVDVTVYDHAARIGGGSWQKQGDEFWAAYIGTVGGTYDIGTILQAARLLVKDEPNIKFFIAGGGPLLQASREKAQHWGMSNVTFTGFLPLDTLAQLLVQADVGLNAIAAGTVSGFQGKVFDYLAAGLPVISSVKGELGTFIQQQGVGASYEAGQAESLRDAILTLYRDPEQRAAMGAQGRRLSRERFDRRVAYGTLLELIDKLCEGHSYARKVLTAD